MLRSLQRTETRPEQRFPTAPSVNGCFRRKYEALPDNPATWYEAHEGAGQVAAAVVVVEEKGREVERY